MQQKRRSIRRWLVPHPPARVVALCALMFALAITAGCGREQSAQHEHGSELGTVSFPVSCSHAAQDGFQRAVALLHHMMYVEARKAFEGIAEEDPDCAMAHWGIAMTLFQPLWPTRPSPEDLRRGWEEAEKAKTLGLDTERESAFVAAVEAFYREPETADYFTRIDRFEQGMKAVHDAYPDDIEAAAFYALSHLATAPRAEDRSAHQEKAARILLEVYDVEPTHPGAIHYTIHANDVYGRADESLEVVRGYDDIAPSVPHALHMPTHIFVRLGEWDEVIEWNRKSADAALKFPAGEFVSHHYPHALDYMIYAYLQQAEDEAAKAVLEELRSKENYQQTFISAYHLAAIPARYYVERREWAEAAALPERDPADFPWEQHTWPRAVTQFARGLGAARTGDRDGARAAVQELAALKAQAESAGEVGFAQQIAIDHFAVDAWLAHAEGRNEEALRLMRSAAELERSIEKHPVTPGALQPAYELLGDLLMELDRPAEALEAYETNLEIWPRRFNSLLGAAQAAERAGDREKARAYCAEFVEMTGESVSRPIGRTCYSGA